MTSKCIKTSLLISIFSYVTFCENTVMQFSNAENYAEMVLPILNMIDQMTQVSYSSMQLGNGELFFFGVCVYSLSHPCS